MYLTINIYESFDIASKLKYSFNTAVGVIKIKATQSYFVVTNLKLITIIFKSYEEREYPDYHLDEDAALHIQQRQERHLQLRWGKFKRNLMMRTMVRGDNSRSGSIHANRI